MGGCQYGLPTKGGLPKQCGKTKAGTITVAVSDRVAPVKMTVCSEHYRQMAARKSGTFYREPSARPRAIACTLVKLT